jgi:hypothetical protein
VLDTWEPDVWRKDYQLMTTADNWGWRITIVDVGVVVHITEV